jgi:hypothetical protein
MAEQQSLLSGGWDRVARNKRYIVWFYILNLALAWFGAGAAGKQADAVLGHSLHADRLLHGFDVGVLIEMLARPDFGPTAASFASGLYFALLFFVATALFLPGILQGYGSTLRLPREDFFRACGRNLWRFIRLMIVAGIAMVAIAGILLGLLSVLEKKAGESTYELLSFEVGLAGLAVIFVVVTAVRIWFDLAETDVVLSDQRAVRRSIGAGFRHMWRNLGQLLGSYVLTTVVAAIVLLAGMWLWMKFVPPASVFGAFFVSQLTLLLLLIPRFWQRGIAVSYYLQNMVEPVAIQPFAPTPISVPVVENPGPTSAIPSPPPEPQGA